MKAEQGLESYDSKPTKCLEPLREAKKEFPTIPPIPPHPPPLPHPQRDQALSILILITLTADFRPPSRWSGL